MIDLNLNPSKKELRTFGLCALVFLARGARVGHRPAGLDRFPLEPQLPIFDCCCRLLLRILWPYGPFWVSLMVVNYPIGWVVTHVIMAIIFYLVVSPVGVIRRLTGLIQMERILDQNAKTRLRWKLAWRMDSDSSRYFRQY